MSYDSLTLSTIVRKATNTDALGILECLAVAFEPYRHQYTPAGFRDTTLDEELIRERLATMTVFVAVREGRIIGTIGCNREGHIRGMAVLPEHQGSGTAQRLLDAAEAEMRVFGCRRVTLDTTQPLRRAIRFYERNGYRATGIVADFFGMPLVQYWKKLR
jgi:GNAT superfamily N-acetyltransferase